MVKGYSLTQIRLHWVIALFIVYQLIFGEGMTDVSRALQQTGTVTMTTAAWAHVIVGILVLLLAIWRLALRQTRGVPPAPEAPALQTLAGHLAHWALYALMILAPLTGLIGWYGSVNAAAEVHELFKPLFIILIVLHVGAALYHQFALKDNLLNRMRQPGE